MTEALTWITLIFFGVLGIWLFKTAFSIKMGRRAARKSGNDNIYRHDQRREDIVDPVSNYDPYKDESFDPDSVELTIFPSGNSSSEPEADRPSR